MAAQSYMLSDPVHRCRYRVLYADTDSGGVVYYGNYLRLFEMGRTEFMRTLASPYAQVEEKGIIMPVTECHIRYRAPARYDDLVLIETSLAWVKRASCAFQYRLSRDHDPEKILVQGATTHAAVNEQGRPVPLPRDLAEQLAHLAGD